MRLLALLLAFVAPFASAQSTSGWGHLYPNGATGVKYVSGGVEIVDGVGGATRIGSTFFEAASAGVRATESLALTVGGNDLTVGAIRTLSGTAIAEAAAAAFAAGYFGFNSVGAPIAKTLGLDQFQLGDTRCTAHYQGWKCDSGEAATQMEQRVYCRSDFTQYCDTDPVAAIRKSVPSGALEGPAGCYYGGTETYTLERGNGTPETGYEVNRFGSGCPAHPPQFMGEGKHLDHAYSTVPRTEQQPACPAVIDALEPAWSIPAGPPGADGKCRTGRYHSATLEEVADRIKLYGDASAMPQMAQTVQNMGQPIATPEPSQLSGPASKSGTPTVTEKQNPDGSIERTTKTPTTTFNFNGAPNTVTYTTVNNVKVENCSTSGSCTTTSTTTTTTPGGSGESDPDNPCVKNPNTLGCAKFGDLPTDKVTPTEKTVTFAEEDLGFGAGACPAPLVMNVHGWELRMSYQMVCDQAGVVKAALLALAYFGTAVMVVTTVVKG